MEYHHLFYQSDNFFLRHKLSKNVSKCTPHEKDENIYMYHLKDKAFRSLPIIPKSYILPGISQHPA